MEPQAADHALKEMFGPLLGKRATPTVEPDQQSTTERPNKSGKQNEGGKGKGPNKRQPGRYRGGGRSSQQGDQDGGLNRETFKLVARALVHQQEAIDTLRLSTGWIWWLRIPEPTVIPTLIEAAELWREQVTKKDSKLRDTPLKQAMFWSLMQFVINTLEQPSEANTTLAKNSGWIDSSGRWVFQRWNPELRALEVDSNRSALTHEELLRTIKEIQSLIHPGDTLSLPCASTARAADGGPDSAGHDGYRAQMPGGDATVSRPHDVARELLAPASRVAVQALDHAAPTTHQADPGLRVSLRSLMLVNPGNWCYLNSAVRALLWAHASDAASPQDVDSERGFSVAGAQATRSLQFLPGICR